MKTLEQIKLEVAKENGCNSWRELIITFHFGDHDTFYDKVAMLYSNAKLQYAADYIDWGNCYDGGAYCATERHEKYIESIKDII